MIRRPLFALTLTLLAACGASPTVAPCETQCQGKQCGPDGCGGSCGSCPVGAGCTPAFVCVTPCAPSCSDRQCGDDGCGGSCGSCELGASCDDAGTCVPDCTPSCTGRECGDDGCGGECGPCAPTDTCTDVGACVPVCVPACGLAVCGGDGCGGACGSCDTGTHCDAGACVADCVPACDGKSCGPDGCGGACGSCETGFHCGDAGACAADCVPACDGKQCGSDGCGGSCGGCPTDQHCGGDAACAPCAEGYFQDALGHCSQQCVPACAAGTYCSPASHTCVPPSLNCLPGFQAYFQEYTAVRYVCTSTPSGSLCTNDGQCWDCVQDPSNPTYADGTYGSNGECIKAGCHPGGQRDCLECYPSEGCVPHWSPDDASCLQCEQSCQVANDYRLCPAAPDCGTDGTGAYLCPYEILPAWGSTVGACVLYDSYGSYTAPITCL
jgi:hypothetical protein